MRILTFIDCTGRFVRKKVEIYQRLEYRPRWKELLFGYLKGPYAKVCLSIFVG